jgi:hypothetical protein
MQANHGRRGHGGVFLGLDWCLSYRVQAAAGKGRLNFPLNPIRITPLESPWALWPPVRVDQLDRILKATTENSMAPLQTSQGTISQDMVTRVGSAAGRVAQIQQDYAMEAEAETATEAREALASRAREAAERAIDEQGISIQDYNAVLSAAEADHELEARLLDAARQVLS